MSFDQLRRAVAEREVAPVDPAFARGLRRSIEAALRDVDVGTPPASQLATATPPATATATATTDAVDQSRVGADQAITPYLAVHDGVAALDWYGEAFGAIETVRYVGDDGRVGHAELVIGRALVMLSDAYPEIGVVAPNPAEGSSTTLHLEVADVDAMYDRVVAAGAESRSAPADQPHGSRTATVVDPYGHRWMLSQRLGHPTVAEIDAAMEDFTVTEIE